MRSVFFVTPSNLASYHQLETKRDIEPHETWRHDGRRLQPGRAIGRQGEIRVERRRVVGVEQVVEIDTGIDPP